MTMRGDSSKAHYGSIDGLRTLAAIGVAIMHVRSNTRYEIAGSLYNTIIASFGNFVLLFMVVSAFSMCCGYYGKILGKDNSGKCNISFTDFYSKRFKKIFPFFALLVILDILVSPSRNALVEGFADLTLLFGFLPNAGSLSVIGVGWFLGLIFVFYICFPFFCSLISSKKKAWIAFAIALIYNYICIDYFNVGSSNILFSGCYFIAGGLIYLYKDEIAKSLRGG